MSFNLQSAICDLQSAVCGLRSAVGGRQFANVIHRMVRMARWPEDHSAPTLPSFRPQIVSGTNVTGSHAYTLQSTITRSATCSAKPADNKDCVHSLNTSKKYCPISSVWWPANAIAIFWRNFDTFHSIFLYFFFLICFLLIIFIFVLNFLLIIFIFLKISFLLIIFI